MIEQCRDVPPTRVDENVVTASPHGPPAPQEHYSGVQQRDEGSKGGGVQQWDGGMRGVTNNNGEGVVRVAANNTGAGAIQVAANLDEVRAIWAVKCGGRNAGAARLRRGKIVCEKTIFLNYRLPSAGEQRTAGQPTLFMPQ